jgi:hypothetical protein
LAELNELEPLLIASGFDPFGEDLVPFRLAPILDPTARHTPTP